MTEKVNSATVVVVLGGGMKNDGTSSQATNLRARAALKLAKANPTWMFILSGDGRSHPTQLPLTEAECMARLFEANGISRARLLLEEESRCTSGNAVLVAARYLRRMQPGRLIIVTSPFHAARARLLFKGVLAREWDVDVHVSSPARGDALRRANEPGGIDWTHRFLAGITPGDLPAAIEKLLSVRPIYAFSQWLQLNDGPGDGDTMRGAAVA